VRRPALRLALTSLSRPGAPTAGVLVSLGAGLSVLVTVALLQGNISREIAERVPQEAPAFFFIDIQPDQATAFQAAVRDMRGVREVQDLPMLRGRIIKVKDVPVKEVQAAPNSRWVTRSEIGFTYTAEIPKGTRLTAGQWWPADYSGPPAVSLDAEIAEGLGVGVGDTLTFSILGRPLQARVANLRIVDWGEFGINFVVLFAPGALEGAPQTHVASARVAPQAEEAVYAAVTSQFANVSTIRVRQVIEALTNMLQRMATAVRATAGLAILSGILVLAGAVAAGHRRRVYDAVILKVLGATRFDVLKAYVIEYALIGGLAALIAAGVGWITAYVVVTEIMNAGWTPLPGVLIVTTLGSLVVTVAVGLIGTWTALSQKPAPLLRVD
jgi:putative ABC transport system permease protein